MQQCSCGSLSVRIGTITIPDSFKYMSVSVFVANMTELPAEAGDSSTVIEAAAGQHRKCFALKMEAIKALYHYLEAIKV